jgi:short-subunit dehydrogenase
VLVARRRDVLDALAEELRGAHDTRTEIIDADLTEDGGIARVEQRVAQGDIALVVNNAGFGTSGDFAALPLARELEEVDLNVRALVRLCHAALGPMYERGGGAIVNVASTGGVQPVPYMATYAGTKAFVLHFSESLHEEAARHGVVVTCLCPGPVKTGFQDAAELDVGRMPRIGWTSVDQVVSGALAAVRRRRAIAIPGAINRATATSVRFVPRMATRKIAGAMFRSASERHEGGAKGDGA